MEITKEIFDTIVKDIIANDNFVDCQKADFLSMLVLTYPQYKSEYIEKLIETLD